jgi:WhiB family redox-sensing transcriptional regulator
VIRPHTASRRYRIGGYTQEHFGWQTGAACVGIDPETWVAKDERIAKRICNGCPIRATCLTETMRVEAQVPGKRYGVFGGLNGDERRKLARKQRTA